MLPDLQTDNHWNGKLYRFKLYKSQDFTQLSKIHQSSAIILNTENKLLVVACKNKFWMLPGGGVEPGETSLDTLHREVYEETAIILDKTSIKPLFYQDVFSLDKNNQEQYLSTQVRYLANIDSQDEFKEDPDEKDIIHHKYISISEIPNYLKWGQASNFLQNILKK